MWGKSVFAKILITILWSTCIPNKSPNPEEQISQFDRLSTIRYVSPCMVHVHSVHFILSITQFITFPSYKITV